MAECPECDGTGIEKQQDGVKGLPVKGYAATQSQQAIDFVNRGKEIEERILRYIEEAEAYVKAYGGDARFAAVGRTQIQLGFMAVFRSVFNPRRIKLPEDNV